MRTKSFVCSGTYHYCLDGEWNLRGLFILVYQFIFFNRRFHSDTYVRRVQNITQFSSYSPTSQTTTTASQTELVARNNNSTEKQSIEQSRLSLQSTMKTTLILAAAAGSAAAFTNHKTVGHRAALVSRGRSSLNMGGATGYSTTLVGKKERVEKVKSLLDSSEMLFTAPASGLTVAEVQQLRRSLPEGTTMSVIKNKLMKKACEGSEYEEATSGLLKGSNMWFFIEEDIGASVKAFNSFTKECDKKESHTILGGVLEGQAYDAKGVSDISKLPSKLELITKIAGSIKAVPTKVAKVIKEPGNKLGRAIKMATADESE